MERTNDSTTSTSPTSETSATHSHPLHRFHRFMSDIGHHEWRIIVVVILILGGIWLTAGVAEAVVEGETHAVDEMILLALREPNDVTDPLGPRWFEEMVRDFTSLGGTGILILIVTAVSGYLVMLRRYKRMIVLLTAVFGGMLLSTLLKGIFDRPRPDLILEGSYAFNASFPSGHALLSAATYLTLGALLAQIQPRFRLKAFIVLLSVFIMVIVGFSRLYLGVHWPSDVLAGWTIGAIWALLCWAVAHWLQENDTPLRE